MPTSINTRQHLLRYTLPLAVLAAGLALAAVKFYRSWPRQLDVEISYPASLEPREVQLDVVCQDSVGYPLSQTVFRPDRSQRERGRLYHSLKLHPGGYQVVCRLFYGEGRQLVLKKEVQVPEIDLISFDF